MSCTNIDWTGRDDRGLCDRARARSRASSDVGSRACSAAAALNQEWPGNDDDLHPARRPRPAPVGQPVDRRLHSPSAAHYSHHRSRLLSFDFVRSPTLDPSHNHPIRAGHESGWLAR